MDKTQYFPLNIMDNFFSIIHIPPNYLYASNKPWQINKIKMSLQNKTQQSMYKYNQSICINAKISDSLNILSLPREYESIAEKSSTNHRR